MRHPFDGVNLTGGEGLTRRSALGALGAAVAGLTGMTSTASAQIATTQAIGEEGGPAVSTLALGEEGGPTTKALGEEGAATRPLTTEPFGEEAGRVVSRAAPGLEDGGAKPVTRAKGENGGPATDAIGENGGPTATTLALGEEGGPSTRALGEEGAATRARGEDGGPTVPVKPNTTELKEAQLKAVWADLAAKDPARGVQACAILYGAKNVIPFMKENLKADKFTQPQADAKTIAKLIADLDAGAFATRQKAEMELAKLGPAAAAAIDAALKEPKSAEQKMRLERLKEGAKESPTMTQGRRALEVLVALRTPEAKELLEKLSRGEEKEWLTQAAKQALARIPKS